MQKLINDIWTDVAESELKQGDQYRIPVGGGGWEQKAYAPPEPEKPVIEIENIDLTNTTMAGSIHWAKKGQEITLEASGALPDGQLMLIIEKAVSAGSNVINDTRIIVNIDNEVLMASFTLPQTGNWFVTADRVNRGLEYINMPFRLNFDTIEFDIHE